MIFLPKTDYADQEKCREIIDQFYYKMIFIFMVGDKFL